MDKTKERKKKLQKDLLQYYELSLISEDASFKITYLVEDRYETT